ncbi:hypothetical protein VQ01_00355 [Tamlana sp. s12]|nr:hypothetical protein VQ01_00355 [Tamlana sp. s12]
MVFSFAGFAQDGKARIIYNGTQIPENSAPDATLGTDFGLNTVSHTFEITRDNISGSDRTIDDMSLKISGNAEFAITEGISASDDKLDAGETEDFTITFTPNVAGGLKTAVVTLDYTWKNKADATFPHTTYSFTIQGGAVISGGSGNVSSTSLANVADIYNNPAVTISATNGGTTSYPIANLIDQSVDDNDRWASSTTGYPQSATVDLGSVHLLTNSTLIPYDERDYQYKIETSVDGTTYNTVVDRTSNTESLLAFTDSYNLAIARYVKLTVTGTGTGYGGNLVELNEFLIFGVPFYQQLDAYNVILGKTPIDFTTGYYEQSSPDKLVNGGIGRANTFDRWVYKGGTGTDPSNFPSPKYAIFDLGKTYSLYAAELLTLDDRNYGYTISVSSDNNMYTEVIDRETNPGHPSGTPAGTPFADNFSTGTIDARYVRIDGLNPGSYKPSNDIWFMSFTELQVFGEAIVDSHALQFDGVDDYVEAPSLINNLSEATLMGWIKLDPLATGDQFIMGESNFYLEIDNLGQLVATTSGLTLTGSSKIIPGIWTHVAARYGGGELELFIDGKSDVSYSHSSSNLGASTTNFNMGRNPLNTSILFHGEMDEMRVFEKDLSAQDIQKMVCQELDDVNPNFGKTIPIQINPDLAKSILGYYKFNNYQNDILLDSNDNVIAAIHNDGTTLRTVAQTAPLPYVTKDATGESAWSDTNTWLHGDIWSIKDTPESAATIVHIKKHINNNHSNNSNNGVDVVNLGLIIDPGAHFEFKNNKKLENSWYLDIGTGGLIDLQGEGQLLQTTESTLGTGDGVIERDQQGVQNLYTYNYWSSPVNNGSGKYTVGGILYDGSNPIQYTGGYDGSQSPVTISEYWLYKFEDALADNYYAWERIKSTGELLVGQGFTMKGTTTNTDLTQTQNYTFTGMPNNGYFTLTLNSGNEYLVGNPYPSALDADQFLTDNQNTIEGTLYFWDHYGGFSHYLKEYEGGYAMYNLSGGVGSAATTPAAGVSPNGGPGTKVPTQFIPVAQGFFVKAATSNKSSNDIVFNNDQRVFYRERLDTNPGSVFIKETTTKASKTTYTKATDARPKIRLGYQSPKGYVRQLLTTVDQKASLHYDWGYDAPVNEDNAEDIYWNIDQKEYFIQGVDTITTQTVLPLTVKTKSGGLIEIKIDSLENSAQNYQVYLKDYDTYHDLKSGSFFVNVDSGIIEDRFAIAFSEASETLGVNSESNNQLQLYFNNQNDNIIISNPKATNIKSLKAVNMLGQEVFDIEIQSSDKKIGVPINLNSDVYVFSVQASESEVSKKVVISN